MLIIPNFGTEHADVCKLGIGQCLFLNDNCQWQHRGAAFAGWDTPATGWQGGQFMTVCSAKDELSRFLGDTTWQRTGLEAYHPSKTTIDMTLPWCGGLEDYTFLLQIWQWLSMIISDISVIINDYQGHAVRWGLLGGCKIWWTSSELEWSQLTVSSVGRGRTDVKQTFRHGLP